MTDRALIIAIPIFLFSFLIFLFFLFRGGATLRRFLFREGLAPAAHPWFNRFREVYRFVEFGRLASGFFHDLLSPLTVMLLHLETLGTAMRHDLSSASEALDRARHAAKRMEYFIRAMRKQVEYRDARELFSLAGAVHEVVELLDYRARSIHVRLEPRVKDLVVHYGNPFRFHQVVLNLVSNALDACEQAGLREGGGGVRVTLAAEGKDALLIVEDSGVGIPASLEKKIFNPFFTTKQSRGGTGMGLSITKEIVEQEFHGTIDVRGKEGRGAVFTVRFPVFVPPPGRLL